MVVTIDAKPRVEFAAVERFLTFWSTLESQFEMAIAGCKLAAKLTAAKAKTNSPWRAASAAKAFAKKSVAKKPAAKKPAAKKSSSKRK